MARSIIPIPGEGLQFIFVENGSLVQIKASVATYNDLPITGNSENDLRITRDTDRMYTWSIAFASGDLSDWLDIGSVSSVDWSGITNGPSSTPAEIDQAVADMHTHTNKALLDTYNQTNSDLSDSVTKKHTQGTDTGTTSDTFVIDSDSSGFSPVKIKNESGIISVRNNADNAYVDFQAKNIKGVDAEFTGKIGNATNKADADTILTSSFQYEFSGGGSVIPQASLGDLQITFNCEIIEVSLFCAEPGLIKIDIWKDTYVNYPPTNSDTITGGNEPEIDISGGNDKYNDSTLTSWTTTLSSGDTLRFHIDSITGITKCIIVLKVRKT